MEIFLNKKLAKHVHVSTLERISRQLFTLLTNMNNNDPLELRQSINKLIVQIIETADKTSLHVLLKLFNL